jgi:hypothetical protein
VRSSQGPSRYLLIHWPTPKGVVNMLLEADVCELAQS